MEYGPRVCVLAILKVIFARMQAEKLVFQKGNMVFNISALETKDDVWAIVETEIEVGVYRWGILTVNRMQEEEILKELSLLWSTFLTYQTQEAEW
jgi:hypothetical protein